MANDGRNVTWQGWEVIQPPIGRGSFGTVYEIRRDVYGDIERAALKVITVPHNGDAVDYLRCSGLDDASITQAFRQQVGDIAREYKLMAQMRENPNVVRVDDFLDVPHEDGLGWDIYIKMELLTPLMRALDHVSSEEQIIRLGQDLCNALVACQEHNVIHRDIKPQNVFVSPNGTFKLGDFGIARTVERTTRATAGIGTVSYMAPEVEKNEPYGRTADIYSLGLLLHWLLNERRGPFIPLPPAIPQVEDEENARYRRFTGEPIPAPAHGSRELCEIVLKACAYDPKERYQSAAEMLEALQALHDKTAVPHGIKIESVKRTDVDDAAGRAGMYGKNISGNGRMFENDELSEGTIGPDFGKKKKKKGSAKKKWIIAMACIGLILLVLLVAAYFLVHVWTEATCTEAPMCKICGKTEGRALGHKWLDATCYEPMTCSVCGGTEGKPLEHEWLGATKTEPDTCALCGMTQGDPLPRYLWQTDLFWDGLAGEPVVTCEDGQASLSFPESTGFASSAVTIRDPYGTEIPEGSFQLQWVDGEARITPSESLSEGVYQFVFTNDDGIATLVLGWGYEEEYYLEFANIRWLNSGWQNRQTEQYLRRGEDGVSTVASLDDSSTFVDRGQICGVSVDADGICYPDTAVTNIYFVTNSYVCKDEEKVNILTYNGWYLAADETGNVYLTNEIDEACYWRYICSGTYETDYMYRTRVKEYTKTYVDTLEGWEFVETFEPESEYSDWSDWSDSAIAASDTLQVEQQQMYRSRTKETKKAYTKTLEGWELYGSSNYEYGPYSAWGTTKYTSSDTLDVESGGPGYRYRWKYYVDGVLQKYYYNDWTIGTPSLAIGYTKTYTQSGSEIMEVLYSISTATTLYRYRTKEYSPYYLFYRWTDWTEWSDTKAVASETVEVEEKTFYRSRDIYGDVGYIFWKWGNWTSWKYDVPVMAEDMEYELETSISYRVIPAE